MLSKILDRAVKFLGAAALAGVVFVTGTGCGADGGDEARRQVEANAELRRRQALDLAEQADLPDGVAAVIGDVAGSVAATYTVGYRASGDRRITIYADPPRRRVDVAAPGRPDQRTIATPDETLVCTRQSSETWRCQVGPAAEPPGAFDARRVATTIDSIRANPDLRATRARIAGVEARCIVSGETTLCVSDAGVPLRVRGLGPDADLEADRYRPSAPDREFHRPPS
jgi:hypothetical protein